MSYTKGELVNSALEELGISSYDFDISPEAVQSGLRKLDSMMAEWSIKGIRLSFPISKIQQSSVDDDSNIPDWAWEAVITNLAIRMAPSYGKTVQPETKIAAKNAYNTLCSNFAKPREMQMSSMPKGAGYKAIDFPYTPEPKNEYLDDVDEEVDLSGGPV